MLCNQSILFMHVCVCMCESLSRVQLLATPWTAAHQAPPPMGFSRQEYWSGVPLQEEKGATEDEMVGWHH